ncbi:MAG TPA: hypothetical protein VM715_21840 [Candidatus Acidoferrum sp.]|nr:hypothetical protein [Candidatus Acidoferrum sp.]
MPGVHECGGRVQRIVEELISFFSLIDLPEFLDIWRRKVLIPEELLIAIWRWVRKVLIPGEL